MARPQPYRAVKIVNRSMTITTRLKKSSSPSRWLMGLPPTSPRFKFMYAHSGNVNSGSPVVPRRPPRQPPSPSTRSRSLELLDQEEQKMSVSSAIVQRPPLPKPRPRSRSLDGLLDEDAKSGVEETCEKQNKAQREKSRSLTNPEEDNIISTSKENQKKLGTEGIELKNEPKPVPRMKSKMPDAVEFQSEMENAQTFSDKDENDKETLLTRPPKPNQCSNSEEQSSTSSSKPFENQERQVEKQSIKETTEERLTTRSNDEKGDYNNDNSTILLKASRSCGAGLDSDGSISSSEYSGPRARAKGPGSLLSLPTGAEPKRKRNFMDKCVNKVRSFMKK